MGYSLQFEPAVRAFLFNCPGLSRADRVRLANALNVLRTNGDHFRNDLRRRLAPFSPHFRLIIRLRGPDGNHRRFRFVVSDAAAVYGVLRVISAQEI